MFRSLACHIAIHSVSKCIFHVCKPKRTVKDWHLLNIWFSRLAIHFVLGAFFFSKQNKFSCIHIMHLDECVKSVSLLKICYINCTRKIVGTVKAAAEVECLNTFWTSKYVILWEYSPKHPHTQAAVTSFPSENFHCHYSHSSEMCLKPSLAIQSVSV